MFAGEPKVARCEQPNRPMSLGPSIFGINQESNGKWWLSGRWNPELTDARMTSPGNTCVSAELRRDISRLIRLSKKI